MNDRKYEYLFLDADDTLFDFKAAETLAFFEFLGDINIPRKPELFETYHKINARCWRMLERGETNTFELRALRFKLWMEETGVSVSITPREVSALYERRLGSHGILFPGAEDVLRELSKTYQLIMVTNGFAAIQRNRLESSGIQKYFKNIYISEEIGPAKPDPAFFDYIFAKENIRDKRLCLVVGDSLTSDIGGAIAAGIDSCWLNVSGKENPFPGKITYIINQLSALPELLKGEAV